ncbi:TIGR04222 domain-containing membrane protein [Kitasatospora sp. NPDC097605]|uniref:TIGR04222 domain-containing membrane protein n=1 Tax=Kitasatospora sp. NPDC097605 TaxID=3157226 RepID=UPI00332AAAA1
MWVVVVLLLGSAVWPARAGLRCWQARVALRRAARLAARREFDLDPYELAGLADNVAVLLMARMHEDGRLVASRSGDITITRALGATDGSGAPGEGDLETALVRWLGPQSTWEFGTLIVDVARCPQVRALRERLAATGLLVDGALRQQALKACTRMGWANATVVLAGVAALGWTLVRGEDWRIPAAAFTALVALAGGVRSVSFPKWRRLTSTGARVLAEAQAADRWKHGSAAVAAHGLSALPEDHDLRVCQNGDWTRAITRRWERSLAPEPEPAPAPAPARHTGRDGGVGACGMGGGGGCGGGGCGGGGCGGGV